MKVPINKQASENKSSISSLLSFLAELKYREVYQTAAAYTVIAWSITEILDGVISRLGWPDWIATLIVILFVVGFPVAIFLAWVFDWTPEGIKRTDPWNAMNWVSMIGAAVFLVAGSGGLFWLINPSNVARLEQVGVAVLPCRYRGEPQYAFRAKGIAGIINDKLAHFEQLHVPSYLWMLELSRQNIATAELGAKAKLSWLVECRIVQSKNNWQIDSSLINVQTDESELVLSINVESSDLVASLESVTLALIQSLGISRQSQKLSERLPGYIRSFDEYLKGEQAMRGKTVEAYQLARNFFIAAQRSPSFELAKVREADALMGYLDLTESGYRGMAAGLRAIELMLNAVEAKAPELAELYTARMRLLILLHKHGKERSLDIEHLYQLFERAIELKPSYAEPYRLMANALGETGKDADVEALLERLNFLNPTL